MTERGDQVQRLMAALARHADLVADAFEGSVETGDRQRNNGIEALVSVNALKPYDEDSYRLNPRLREFIADHLVSYSAFTALTRLAGPIAQLRQQWQELKGAKSGGTARDIDRLEMALDETVVDIAYTIERNLALLQSMVSTQYGNVSSLQSKLNQNRYYDSEVSMSLKEVAQVDDMVERIADEAIAAGLPHIRQLVTRRLGSRLLQWSANIKDAQATISKRLFEARLLEQKLKRMARYSLWLSRNKTLTGWDLDVRTSAPAELFRPEPIPQRPQPAIQSADAAVQAVLVEIAGSLKAPRNPLTADTTEQVQTVISMEMGVSEVVAEDHEQALDDLVEHLSSHTGVVRLSEWRATHPRLQDVEEEFWLLYASCQLRGDGFDVRFLQDGEVVRQPINESFYDVDVRAKLREGV